MTVKFLVNLLLFIFSGFIFVSCAEDKKDYSQTDKCHVDGANLYLKCADSTQKVIELGYGNFDIIKDKIFQAAKDFCKTDSYKMSINVRNSHFNIKEKQQSGTIAELPGSINECQEVRLYDSSKKLERVKIEAVSLNKKPPHTTFEF